MTRRSASPSVIEKPQDTKKTLNRLFTYIKEVKWLFALAILLTLLANGLQLLGPFLTGNVIDLISNPLSSNVWDRVVQLVLLMLMVYVISSLILYALSSLMIYISQKIVVKMRQDLFNKFLDLPVSYFDRHQVGDMLSRISYDIDTINTSLSSDLVQLFGSFVVVIGAFSMMLWISLPLISIFFITIPLSILSTRFLSNRTRPLFRDRSRKLGDMNGYVEETISGLKTIKAYSQQNSMVDTFKDKNKSASDAYYKADYYGSIVGPTVGFINNISLTLISVFGSILFILNMITIGNISSFLLYSRKFSGPISESANMVAELQSTLAAAERVFRVLEEPIESVVENPTILPKPIHGDIQFNDVSFGYIKYKLVLKDVNIDIKSGSLVAIVGPTGAGKTTLINLLMRFYAPNKGKILIDGIDISKLSQFDLRSSFSMVLQDSWLFHGSIYDNLIYGNEHASKEDVLRISKEVHIHNFIERTKLGYESLISDDGVNLSKGQRQLITIARALLADKPMIILDEATSNVDTLTEKRIQSAMKKLMHGKTCFVIAHRLSTIINADTILVVHDGNVVEQGKHAELMLNKGHYYHLYMAQFA
jgi:ATP-binding cassette, subfamily B, multidrug efflux pump